MSKQPFTDNGVSVKTQELYALPDNTLRAETESLRVDFKSWMQWHFDLNADQSAFLESMAYPSSQILAEDLADCIKFRLPLFITWPPMHPIGSKFVMPASELLRSYNPDGSYTVTGRLNIEIGYK